MNALHDPATEAKWLSSPDMQPSSDTIDMRQLIRILRRRKYTIVGVVALCMSVAVAYLVLATPIYQSNIEVVVEGNSGPLVVLDDRDSSQLSKDINIDDAVQLIQSRKLALRIIEQLGLVDDPEFQPSPFSKWIAGIRQRVLPSQSTPVMDKALQQKVALNRLAQAFLDRLNVQRIERSNVLLVSFDAKSPELAWKVATAIGDSYLAWRIEQKAEGAQKANAWLDERTSQLAEQVRQADKAAQEYRGSHGLLEGERVALISEQLSKVSANLIDASAARKRADADLAQVRRILALGGDISSARQILDSAIYVRLRDQQLEIEREYAQLSRELGPRHPYILQLQAKRERAQQDIRAEISKVALSLENQAAAARQQEASLTADLSRLKQDLAQANLRAVELHAIEQEADTRREMLHKMVSDAIEQDAQRSPGAQSSQARVISDATFPEKPARPKKALLLVLAGCGSLLLGTLCAFLSELLDVSYRSSGRIERELGVPVLSYVPRLRRAGRSQPHLSITAAPFSASAEAVRAVRARLSAVDPTAKALAVASAEPEEGKSTLAVAIAITEARAGRKVLLIDADIRMSGVARKLGLAAESGLVDVLLDGVAIGRVVKANVLPGVDVVPARGELPRDRDADAVTAKPGMLAQALTGLRFHYDLILIDSPPVAVLSDAQVVAAIADVAILVVAWGQTSRQSVQTAVGMLRAAGGHLAGVVFNKVDEAVVAHYTQGEAGCCNRRYRQYYALTGENA